MHHAPASIRRPIEILHLAYSQFPADTRVKRETEALLATGRRVAVVALRGIGQRAVERRRGIVVIRVHGQKSRGGFLSYIGEYADFVWRCRRLLARHRQLAHVRIVHVHTLPDFLLWAALPAQHRGARVVLDMHEIFPEFAASKFHGPGGRLLAAVARWTERWARRKADLTITVNHPIEELLKERGIGRPERLLIIHNSADPADFGTEPTNSAGDRTARPVELVYHGTVTSLYGLDLAIQGVAQARDKGLDVRLTIIGDGPEREALKRLAIRIDASGFVRFETPIPQRELPARLGACDAGVVPTNLNGMTQYSLSTKLLEYAHLGIPVLAARLPCYRRYFGDHALWYWTPGDPADLARAIGEFAASPTSARLRRARLAREAMEPFAWPRESAALLAAYEDLLADEGNRWERTAAMSAAELPSP